MHISRHGNVAIKLKFEAEKLSNFLLNGERNNKSVFRKVYVFVFGDYKISSHLGPDDGTLES